MAAAQMGWDYPRLLEEILSCTQTLSHIRGIDSGKKDYNVRM